MRIIHILGRFTPLVFVALVAGVSACAEYTRDRLYDLGEIALELFSYRPDANTSLFLDDVTSTVSRDDSRSSAFLAFIRRALRHDHFSAGQFHSC